MRARRAGRCTGAAVASSNIGRVVLWMMGALLSFTAMAVSVRELGSALSVVEMLAIRNIAGLAVLGGLALARPELRQALHTRRLPLHGLRNVIHFGAQCGWAEGLLLLPLSTVFALEFTAPIWVALLAVLILGERMTASRFASVVLGFLGVLVILRPGFASIQPAMLLVLAAAVGFACVSIATKRLTATESTFTILFYMNLMQLPMNLAFSDPVFVTKLHIGHLWPVLGMAVSGLTSHFCLTNAFRSGDAILVVPLDFLRIPLIALVGWIAYGESLQLAVLLGAALIVAGIVGNLWNESRRIDRPGS